VETLTKDEVMKRPELKVAKGEKSSNFKIEGNWGENFFWDGGECWFPVIHRGQRKRKRLIGTPFYNEE
jgi:hypothetical protein